MLVPNTRIPRLKVETFEERFQLLGNVFAVHAAVDHDDEPLVNRIAARNPLARIRELNRDVQKSFS